MSHDRRCEVVQPWTPGAGARRALDAGLRAVRAGGRAALVLVAALGVAAPAAAQDPEVDPGSPAGTEYRLPIDRARDEASATRPPAGARAPLFGEGVERDAGRSPGGGSGAGRGAGAPAPSPGGGEPRGPGPPGVARGAADEPAGGVGVAAIGAGAALVLAVGGLAGLLWRRRAGRDPV